MHTNMTNINNRDQLPTSKKKSFNILRKRLSHNIAHHVIHLHELNISFAIVVLRVLYSSQASICVIGSLLFPMFWIDIGFSFIRCKTKL
jgi:hypothetical protein